MGDVAGDLEVMKLVASGITKRLRLLEGLRNIRVPGCMYEVDGPEGRICLDDEVETLW